MFSKNPRIINNANVTVTIQKRETNEAPTTWLAKNTNLTLITSIFVNLFVKICALENTNFLASLDCMRNNLTQFIFSFLIFGYGFHGAMFVVELRPLPFPGQSGNATTTTCAHNEAFQHKHQKVSCSQHHFVYVHEINRTTVVIYPLIFTHSTLFTPPAVSAINKRLDKGRIKKN